MEVEGKEEGRGCIGMGVAEEPAMVDVSEDVFD